MNTLLIKSVPVVIEPRETVQQFIQDALQKNDQFLPLVTFNFSMIGAHSKALLFWLSQKALFIPDGVGISLLLFFRYFLWVPRYPGIDLVDDILMNMEGRSLALIGATPDALSGAITYIRTSYPTHAICFQKDGFSKMTEDDYVRLSDAKPDLILVAMGCPLQESVIWEMSNYLESGVAIGVGGTFDVWSGQKKRAPQWVQMMGLEWVYRLSNEPKRLGRFMTSFVRLFR